MLGKVFLEKSGTVWCLKKSKTLFLDFEQVSLAMERLDILTVCSVLN